MLSDEERQYVKKQDRGDVLVAYWGITTQSTPHVDAEGWWWAHPRRQCEVVARLRFPQVHKATRDSADDWMDKTDRCVVCGRWVNWPVRTR